MAEMAVGVRELKSNLKPTLEARLQVMIDAGLLTWSGRKFKPMKPVAKTRGARTVADLISEDRR
mgnify:CR=1 FL=1